MLLGILTCKENLERLDDYLDRELSPRETQLVERHLRICHECSRRFAFERDLIDGIRTKIERIEVPTGLLDQIRAEIGRVKVGGEEKFSEKESNSGN